MKIWESEEFDHMLAIVNDEEPKACTTTFLNKILQKESTTTTEANNESDNFPGEKTFTILKKHYHQLGSRIQVKSNAQ